MYEEKTQDDFKNDIPIVFVPALMGTTLQRNSSEDGKYEDVYITSSIALGMDNPDIALPIGWNYSIAENDPNDENVNGELIQFKDDIVPGDALKSIELSICCCATITVLDQYEKFCTHFKRFRNFHTFCYDWRRDLNESTNKLLNFLKKIKSKYGVPAQVVSHSMGCLIALAACNTSPNLFHSNCFVGGMFAGGVGFFPLNTEGMVVGVNCKYLSPDVLHTFPSMFAASSPMGVCNDPILRDGHGTQLWQYVDSKDITRTINIDMYNIEDWKKYKIGPWRYKEKVSDMMEQHVKNCLHLGFIFQLKLRNLEVKSDTLVMKESLNVKSYPPVAVLVGDKFMHPEYFLWDSERKRNLEWTKKLRKEYNPKCAKTDGTVSCISASQPSVPAGVKIHKYNSRNNGPNIGSHRELMHDPNMIELILRDLQKLCSL